LTWFWWSHVSAQTRPLPEHVSVSGYSLAVYAIAIIVCTPPVQWLRYLAVSISLFISCTCLLRNLWPQSLLPGETKRTFAPVFIVLVLVHVLLAGAVKFYFFP